MEHLGHPSPHFNDAKMARFCSFAPSSLLWGRWGIIVPFYTVQDCLRRTMALQEAMFAMQITSDLLSHARLARKKNVSGTKIL